MKTIRIGGGAGYAGDRIDPAVELIEKGNLDYIMFECIGERTVGLCHQDMMRDPSLGYSRMSDVRLEQVLKPAKEHNVKIITNLGAANPIGAMRMAMEIAKRQNLHGIKFAAVTGDSILDSIDQYYGEDVLEFDAKLGDIRDKIVSSNTYYGAEGIIEALKNGADVVITGRVSDPALTVGPLCYEYGWNLQDNPNEMGQAILAGHLIECGSQVTGGYFADPGYKDVERLWETGFPIAEFHEDGTFYITKVEGSGGVVNERTVKEQMLYEIHNPAAYITPDATADFSQATITDLGNDRVMVKNATTHGRPTLLKVNISYRDSFTCDCGVTCGGSNSLEKARYYAEVMKKRFEKLGIEIDELRTDFIGFNSLYKDDIARKICGEHMVFPEIRLRMCARTKDYKNAQKVYNEWDSILCNGPSGCGGSTMHIAEIISVCSIFVPRSAIDIKVTYEEI